MNHDRDFDHNIQWQSAPVAANYDERRFTSLFGRFYDSAEKRVILNLLTRAQQECRIDTILDIPCGTGRISEFLLKKDYKVECADISEEMIGVAKSRIGDMPGLLGFDVLDIYNIARTANSYDCVSCIRLFQHLKSEERAASLVELSRVSKRYVIVNVMYTSRYYGMVRKLRQRLGRYAPRYTTSAAELKRETEAASLSIVKSAFSQPGYNGNLILLLEKE